MLMLKSGQPLPIHEDHLTTTQYFPIGSNLSESPYGEHPAGSGCLFSSVCCVGGMGPEPRGVLEAAGMCGRGWTRFPALCVGELCTAEEAFCRLCAARVPQPSLEI